MGKKRPTHELKLGKIRAAIWANESEKHKLWFNVTVSRLYKEDGDWKDTSSFGRDDLPVVCKAVDMAYGWILRRERQLEQEQRESTQDEE
jgi:hypothetical protein